MDRLHPSVTLVEASLPRDARCARLARALVREHLGRHVSAKGLETALLVTSELVTNAWKHGEGAITFRLERDGPRVRLEVTDEGTGAIERIRPQAGDETGGWGLQLVGDLATRWGCFEGTTHVWAEIVLSCEPV